MAAGESNPQVIIRQTRNGLYLNGVTAEDMFNGIDMVGNDLDLNRAMTAPTFRIRSMQIGGD